MVVLVAITSLLLADVVSGLVYRTSTAASAVVTQARSGRADELLVVFGGYASDCLSISRAFEPELDDRNAMVVLCYAERGVDDDDVFRTVMQHVEDLQPESIRVLGGSLGGLVAVRFLERYRDSPQAADLGPVVLVLDTAPSSSQTVRRPQWLFAVARWYRGGVISSAVWHLLSGLGERPDAEPDAATDVIRRGEQANASVGMPALTSQAAYLASFSSSELADVGDVVTSVTYLRAEHAHRDPLIDVHDATDEWSHALPGTKVVDLPERNGAWHVPWTYRPHETLEAVLAA